MMWTRATGERLDAGGASLYEPVEQVWGDRDAGVQDPSGNNWYLTARRLSAHVPADTPTIVPGFSTRGADRFIDFTKRAFGAEEAFMHKSPTRDV